MWVFKKLATLTFIMIFNNFQIEYDNSGHSDFMNI